MPLRTDYHSASSILSRVKGQGKIKLETLILLLKGLDKAGYDSHIEVGAIRPNTALLKTIDNETDALKTIANIKKKYGDF